MRLPSWDCAARWAGLDLRSLALFRVALALQELLEQFLDVNDGGIYFLSDSVSGGVVPRSVWATHDVLYWSLHAVHGSATWYTTLCLARTCALVMLLLGWHTRAATVVAFVLHVSQNYRDDILINSFDGFLLPALLFLGCWLPLGAVWSVDALKRRLAPLESPGGQVLLGRRARSTRSAYASEGPRQRPTPTHVLSTASVCLCVQLWVLYYVAMYSKKSAAWTTDYTALQLVLQHSRSNSLPAARWLLQRPKLCELLTALTAPVEYVLPVLLILPAPPWSQLWVRLPCVLGLTGFHLSIAAVISLHTVPYINIVALLPFVPSAAWGASAYLGARRGARAEEDEAEGELELLPVATRATSAAAERELLRGGGDGMELAVEAETAEAGGDEAGRVVEVVLLEYGSSLAALLLAIGCEINSVADGRSYLLRRPQAPRPELQPQQSGEAPAHAAAPARCGIEEDAMAEGAWRAAAAAASLARLRCMVWPLLRAAACAAGRNGRLALRLARDFFLVWLMVGIVWFALSTKDVKAVKPAPEWLNRHWKPLLKMTDLNQYWAVFAPAPLPADAWVVMPAMLSDGRRVDLLPAFHSLVKTGNFDTAAPVDLSRRHCPYCTYPPSQFWRRHLEYIGRGFGKNPSKAKKERIIAYRAAFVNWVCRRWNVKTQANHSRATGGRLLSWNLTYLSLDNTKIVSPPGSALPLKRNSTVGVYRCFG